MQSLWRACCTISVPKIWQCAKHKSQHIKMKAAFQQWDIVTRCFHLCRVVSENKGWISSSVLLIIRLHFTSQFTLSQWRQLLGIRIRPLITPIFTRPNLFLQNGQCILPLRTLSCLNIYVRPRCTVWFIFALSNISINYGKSNTQALAKVFVSLLTHGVPTEKYCSLCLFTKKTANCLWHQWNCTAWRFSVLDLSSL